MTQLATFGAGCFWGIQALFEQQAGIDKSSVGYMGGLLQNPSYEDVCTGRSQHVEVVQLEFDNSVISFPQLLQLFWSNHDPTTLNRQGPDRGTQYRSVVFFHSPQQQAQALTLMSEMQTSSIFSAPIVTAIEPAQEYWPAEEYHQHYLAKRQLHSCRI
ncbi:MAG: peptide-methionine (S)-S-oxide reductase MsrA [Gammaproteobacteria bacterium]|nr:peptide-methionine (S)-S-oxide reductase MsrA [Gammaproteobacteria bacterium]